MDLGNAGRGTAKVDRIKQQLDSVLVSCDSWSCDENRSSLYLNAGRKEMHCFVTTCREWILCDVTVDGRGIGGESVERGAKSDSSFESREGVCWRPKIWSKLQHALATSCPKLRGKVSLWKSRRSGERKERRWFAVANWRPQPCFRVWGAKYIIGGENILFLLYVNYKFSGPNKICGALAPNALRGCRPSDLVIVGQGKNYEFHEIQYVWDFAWAACRYFEHCETFQARKLLQSLHERHNAERDHCKYSLVFSSCRLTELCFAA